MEYKVKGIIANLGGNCRIINTGNITFNILFSKHIALARKLKLKIGDKVEIIIRKVK